MILCMVLLQLFQIINICKDFKNYKPDIVLITVDRIETLGATISSIINLPTHIQGGHRMLMKMQDSSHQISRIH